MQLLSEFISVPHSQIDLTSWTNSVCNTKPRFPVLFTHILKLLTWRSKDHRHHQECLYNSTHTCLTEVRARSSNIDCKVSDVFDSNCYIFNATLILVVRSEQKMRHFIIFLLLSLPLYFQCSAFLFTELLRFFTNTEAIHKQTYYRARYLTTA